jgi:hypothetical protein
MSEKSSIFAPNLFLKKYYPFYETNIPLFAIVFANLPACAREDNASF